MEYKSTWATSTLSNIPISYHKCTCCTVDKCILHGNLQSVLQENICELNIQIHINSLHSVYLIKLAALKGKLSMHGDAEIQMQTFTEPAFDFSRATSYSATQRPSD